MNTQSPILKAVIIFLAIIGLITVISLAGMLGMHAAMGGTMGSGGMWQRMTSMCNMHTSP
jgi:hypothetical protein